MDYAIYNDLTCNKIFATLSGLYSLQMIILTYILIVDVIPCFLEFVS